MALALAKTNLPANAQTKSSLNATDKGSEPMMGATGMSNHPNKRQAGVIEMLEYVKGLDIDPIKESDMLWIAEEAFNAPLPPNWSEHFDDQGRVYFHNAATGESAWQHPMDDMFRQIVEYYRRVRREGGFWYVEDEIAELEENIREGLSDWMELFDELGEKFYYNRSTAESTFDDPRVAVYHNLYARIKMVAKMKEHLPLLARAPRPEDPTPQELELRRRQEEEEKKYVRCVLRVQAMARVLVARRKMRQMQQRSLVARGHQPLKGKLRLRLESVIPGGAKELVLAQTTPHRRAKAATKIQTRMRGVMARKRFKPMLLHHMYQSRKMVPIQSWARVWLAKRRVKNIRRTRQIHAVHTIQRLFRGFKDRQYVATLKAEKTRFQWMMYCIVRIQAQFRRRGAYIEKERRKNAVYATRTLEIQAIIRTFLAQRDFLRRQMLERPIQTSFSANFGEDQVLTPWTWRVQMAPLSEEGVWLPEPHGVVDLFQATGNHDHAIKAAATIQRYARGMFGRLRVRRRLAMGTEIVNSVIDNVFKDYTVRMRAIVRIQCMARGRLTRKQDFKKTKFLDRMKRSLPQIKLIQAQVHRFLAQEWMISQLAHRRQNEAVIIIQKQWRGWMARRHCEALLEQSLWPLKGWFEYTPMGPNIVSCEVRFLPNPSFDDYRYFVEHGSAEDLNLSLEEMQLEVALCVDQYLAERGMRPMSASEEKQKIAKKAAPGFSPFVSGVEDLPAFPDKLQDGSVLMEEFNPLMEQQRRDQEMVMQKMQYQQQLEEQHQNEMLKMQQQAQSEEFQSAMLDSVAGLDSLFSSNFGVAEPPVQNNLQPTEVASGQPDLDSKQVEPMQSVIMQTDTGLKEVGSIQPVAEKTVNNAPQQTTIKEQPPAVNEPQQIITAEQKQLVMEVSLPESSAPLVELQTSPIDPSECEVTPRKPPSIPESQDIIVKPEKPEKVDSGKRSREGSRRGSRQPSREKKTSANGSRASSRRPSEDKAKKPSREAASAVEVPPSKVPDDNQVSVNNMLVTAPETSSEVMFELEDQKQMHTSFSGMMPMGSAPEIAETPHAGASPVMADPFRETRKTNSTGGGTFGAAGWVPAEIRAAEPEAMQQKTAPFEPQPQAPMRKAQDSGEAKISKKSTKKQAERAGQFEKTYKQEQRKDGAQRRKKSPVEQPLETRAHEVLRERAHAYPGPDEVSPPGPPRAPAKVNAPPPPGGPAGVRDVGAVDIRSTSSRALHDAEDGIQDDGGLPPVRPPSRSKSGTEPIRVDDRASYGGKIVGGRFYKNQISSVDELSKEEQQKIIQDLEDERKRKIEELAARQKQHEMRRRKQEMQEKKKYHMQQSSSTPDLQQDDEGRSKKVIELKKWLQKKEDESRRKREAEQLAMKELLDREKQKVERRELTEKARLAEREKRLKVADRRKAELEQQMQQGRAGASTGVRAQSSGRAADDASNVMHRHIHHHIHYHQEGDEEGEEGAPMHSSDEYESSPEEGTPGLPRAAPSLSVDEQRRIEQESEQTVRSQLPIEGGMGQSFGGSSAADYAYNNHPAPSVGGESSEMQRTIESFAPHVNAALRRSHSESAMPRQAQNPRYAQSVQRATGAYADPGRPRYGRGGQPSWS